MQLSDDAPGVEDIEAYFLDAANRMFGDLMSGTTQTPERYVASGQGLLILLVFSRYPLLLLNLFTN